MIELECSRRFKRLQLTLTIIVISIFYIMFDKDISSIEIFGLAVFFIIAIYYGWNSLKGEFYRIEMNGKEIQLLNIFNSVIERIQRHEINRIEDYGHEEYVVLLENGSCFYFKSSTKDGQKLYQALKNEVIT